MTKFRRRTELGLPLSQHVPSENPKITTLSDIQSLARDKTEAALLVLAAIMNRETANAFARVAAAKELLDRGWGRPVQQLATDAGPVEYVHKIERVIVHHNQPHGIADQVNGAGDLSMSQTISPRTEILR
ncbi:hypothetical protein WI604_09555 [Bradyrhizobium symbiodeficiens]|uniref:hypothetical protein n=1 Tax=Bradyrhizobium symbiodeficiens TaxID=1404367 RepID=UPI0030CF08A9